MNLAAQDIAQLLAAVDTGGAFATRFSVDADPQLHIAGIGNIPLPITLHSAHQLCAIAQPAQHGYKDQTLLDPRVRDTWEITAEHLRFDSPQWPAVLDRALKRAGRDLGLPDGTHFTAELHNLLVYAPGQFFAVHQDSEKRDGMLGTLIITLPSRFSGGEFVVSHQGQTLRARGSSSRLGMVAFYADCHHEARPVKQGYRVVLTYNLIVQGETSTRLELPNRELAALTSAVQRFWQTPPPPRWTGDRLAAEPPDRLVYLLDHQYTQKGLCWSQLKGVDAARATALRKVAEQADAEIFLTLADVHEVWSTEDDYQGHDHWHYPEEDEEDEEGDADIDEPGAEPVLGELIDSDIELRHWLAPDDSRLASSDNRVSAAELCFTRPSVDCAPFQSEYEGYMGNYGNTLDRWYHRAAVVMWPRERAFLIRARQSPRWAIEQIIDRLDAGESSQALTWAQSLRPFWKRAVATANDNALPAACLKAVIALDNAELGSLLLAPFSLQHLSPDMAPKFKQLLDHYGLAWCSECLRQWAQSQQKNPSWHAQDDQLKWLAQTLPVLTHAWSTITDGPALSAMVVEERWQWLLKSIKQQLAYGSGSNMHNTLEDTSPALLGLIRAQRDIRRPDLQQAIIDTLLSTPLPLEVPLGVLHASAELPETDRPDLAPVHAHCLQVLEARLAQPERADDDWSISPPTTRAAEGKLGETLAQFLSDPTQRRLAWPLAKAGRQTIHQLIDFHELPVRHETQRSGRPFTLVLEKTPALFEQAAAERRQWKQELAWLRQTQNHFQR